jgi:hypothetical protein
MFSRSIGITILWTIQKRLLGNEMKNIKKDPVFPEVKRTSEAIFSRIIDSVLTVKPFTILQKNND